MPIEMKNAAWVGDKVFPTIEQAQRAELLTIFSGIVETPTDSENRFVSILLENSKAVVSILTSAPPAPKPRKVRKVRSDLGTKRGQRHVADQHPLPLKA